jgi:hypothetical protein
MQRELRRTILRVLVGLLLLTATWRCLRTNPGVGPERGASDPGPRAAPPRSSVAAAGDRFRENHLAALNLPSLDAVRSRSAGGRDPWRFVDPPSRKPAPEPAASSSPPQPFQPPPSLPVVNPPDFTLEYLGNFGPPEKKIAVFSDGKQVRNAMEGTVIDGKFRVASIGYESVEIQFLGFPGWPAKPVGVRRR